MLCESEHAIFKSNQVARNSLFFFQLIPLTTVPPTYQSVSFYVQRPVSLDKYYYDKQSEKHVILSSSLTEKILIPNENVNNYRSDFVS